MKREKLIKYALGRSVVYLMRYESGRQATLNWKLKRLCDDLPQWEPPSKERKRKMKKKKSVRRSCVALMPVAPYESEWVPSQWIFIGLPMTTSDDEWAMDPIKQVARADFDVFFFHFYHRLFRWWLQSQIRSLGIVVGHSSFTQFVIILFRWFSPSSADCPKGFSLSPSPLCVCLWFAVAFVIGIVIIHNWSLRNQIGMRE